MNSFLISHSLQSVATMGKMLLPSLFTPNSLSNPVCLQCVRWRRKPRWIPVAKTKIYRIPVRIKYSPESVVEVSRLFNNYRTSMKAIRYYLSEKIKSQTTAPEVIAEQLRLQQEEHDRCLAINDEWNSRVAQSREKRVAAEIEETREHVLKAIAENESYEEEELRKIEELVRSEKEKSKTYITPENIDEAIEMALKQTVDYNYCIDLSGNIYRGIRARPGVTDPDKPESLSENKNRAVIQ